MPVVGGVDGAKGQWLLSLVELGPGGGSARAVTLLLPNFTEVVEAVNQREVSMVGVDMPIGLPDVAPRASDALARERLGARRSTLFATPPARVVHIDNYTEANAAHRELTGKGLSKQAFNLFGAIRQVRAAIQPDDPRFHEAHPDTSFATIAHRPLAPKKSAAGVGERIGVLQAWQPNVVDLLASAPGGVGVDDILDSLVAAWSASRHLAGAAEVLGRGQDTRGYGLHLIA